METIGTGILGIGALIDLAGNDSYNGDVMSIGSSFIGVGMLVDEKGDGRYNGQEYTEGCSFFGSGIILDLAGDDHYSATYLSQGLGGTKGLGIMKLLTELNEAGNTIIVVTHDEKVGAYADRIVRVLDGEIV